MTKKNIIAITLLLFALFITVVFNNLNKDIIFKFENFTTNYISSGNVANNTIVENKEENDNNEEIKEEYPTEILNRYYYNQLDENAKIIYTYLEKNVDNLKTGTYTIDFGTTFNLLLQQNDGKEILVNAFGNAMFAFFRDMPQVFYIDSNKMRIGIESTIQGTNVTYKVILGNKEGDTYYAKGFTSKDQVEEAINNIEQKRTSIIASTNGDLYNRILQVHDYLVDNMEYDITMSRANAYNLYGALGEGVVVCKGYAEAFKYILDGMEVPCIILSGTGIDSNGNTESHAWNYVKLNDIWYAVDVTWDDAIIVGNNIDKDAIKYRYFLKGSGTFNGTHIQEGKLSPESMTFVYPELSLEDYVY